MNITYLVGTVLAIVFMVFGMVSKTVDGAVTFQLNQIVNFFDASSILIVIGCTLAVVVASCPVKLIKAIKTVIKDKKGEVLIYPEAHVWPYYTKIRPFDATSMHFPVQLNAPSFVMTKTYHKRRFGKRPRAVVYIDGPFYPDQTLSRKEAQNKLHDEIQKTLIDRAKLSDYEYCQYIKK